MKQIITTFLYLIANNATSQTTLEKIQLIKENERLQTQIVLNDQKIEIITLNSISKQLNSIGYPSLKSNEQLIQHNAMLIAFNNQHKQPSWVMHFISPDVKNAAVGRSNNFRIDSLVTKGTCTDSDYFLSIKTQDQKSDSIIKGYGFDRGHLAPAADFRWSPTAMSESFLYSNMCPQIADFNRGEWANLEAQFRSYVINKKNNGIYVITGAILNDSLKSIPESPNKVSIPGFFYKIAIDTTNNKGIAYLMPNHNLDEPNDFYARSIDSIETLTGLDFFPNLSKTKQTEIESQNRPEDWKTNTTLKSYPTIPAQKLGLGQCNTKQALDWTYYKEIEVCGTLVHTYKGKKGTVTLYLDRSDNDCHFKAIIISDQLPNFSSNYPFQDLKGKKIGIRGRVSKDKNNPEAAIMYIYNEEQVQEIYLKQ